MTSIPASPQDLRVTQSKGPSLTPHACYCLLHDARAGAGDARKSVSYRLAPSRMMAQARTARKAEGGFHSVDYGPYYHILGTYSTLSRVSGYSTHFWSSTTEVAGTAILNPENGECKCTSNLRGTPTVLGMQLQYGTRDAMQIVPALVPIFLRILTCSGTRGEHRKKEKMRDSLSVSGDTYAALPCSSH